MALQRVVFSAYVALQRSKSSAAVHGGGRIEAPINGVFNTHSNYLCIENISIYIESAGAYRYL